MTHDELVVEWEKDCGFDPTNVQTEQVRAAILHGKYFNFLMKETKQLIGLKAKYKQLYKEKWEFYTQGQSFEQWKEKRWEEPAVGKVLKKEADIYLDSDKEMLILSTRIALQEEMVEGIKTLLKTISNRTFMIKNIIEDRKWKGE